MSPNETTAHDFTLNTLSGKPLPLNSFAGRPILIVNTASKCGFTPQYAALQQLWQDYKARGLVVLGVPCNDFGNQEPGDTSEIGAFCERNYGVGFQMAEKVHVRGPEIHPLYKWLASQGGWLSRPHWNFHKYLVGRDGRMQDWFSTVTSPAAPRLRHKIEQTLSA